MDIKVDAENVTAAGGAVGGIAALWGSAMVFIRRQRAKGERFKAVELTAQNAARAVESVRKECRDEISGLRGEMQSGFQHLENLILGRSK